jgi:rhamnosyltransferase subunit B
MQLSPTRVTAVTSWRQVDKSTRLRAARAKPLLRLVDSSTWTGGAPGTLIAMTRKRIVLATFGSLGDVHPLLPVAFELRSRGHDVVFATSAVYEEKIRAAGLEFHPLRPDIPREDPATIAYMLDSRRGPERLLREFLMPAMRDQYADLSDATRGADLMLASELIYAAPLVAEKSGIRWATHVLAPLSFFSRYDPPVVPNFPEFAGLYRMGPSLVGAMMSFGRLLTRPWIRPLLALRRELGLGAGPHPVFEGKFSPSLVLAMFSRVIGAPQRDWPANTRQTGFSLFDADGDGTLPDDVEAFLASGEPPLVFTLGSSAVVDPGRFFHESVEAAARLGRRALLIAGEQRPVEAVPESVHVSGYIPYSRVFPRAAAVVHPGGIGTTAQALRAGTPMVVVPYSFDQPDNAARLRRAGVSETVPRHLYRGDRVASVLSRILIESRYRNRARELAREMSSEDGAAGAADALVEVASRVR